MKILAAQPLAEFKLRLGFSDGTDAVVDLSDFAGKGVFQAWVQPGIFEQVRVTDFGAVSWPGDLDMCPDALYLRATGNEPEEVLPGLTRSLTHA
ncbi:MAG: DUF2442 domain-containing protein [Terrimicrobiaceae bacterium]|nr:DUF2442 domain-containing protein [Terrimicrobiaceae bacterium]